MGLDNPPTELHLGEQLPTHNPHDDYYDPLEPEFWSCFCGNEDRDRFHPCSSLGLQEDVDEYTERMQSYWFPRWYICIDCRRTIRTLDRRVVGVYIEGGHLPYPEDASPKRENGKGKTPHSRRREH